MKGLDDVKKELDGKRQVLSHELQEAQARIDAIEADLRKIDDALAALEGKKPKGRKSPKKPAVTVDELREMIASVRKEFPYAETVEFEKELRDRVKQTGRSLSNFKRTYERALEGMPSGSEPFGLDQPLHDDQPLHN